MRSDLATRPRLRLVADAPAVGEAPGPPVATPAPARDDTELLAAARRGDATAAPAIHDRVRPQIDRTISRLLGRRSADKDDLAQLALMGILAGIDRFRGDCSLDSWVSAVTARVIYKHLRRRKTERRIFEPPSPEEPASSAPPADAATRQLLQRVLAHVSALEEAQGWTFMLHDVCGHDLREVAAITGASVSAAQSRLVRGRRALHERIAEDPDLAHFLQQGGTSR